MDTIIRGQKLSYWKNNAEDEVQITPLSVLKYITVLEEAVALNKIPSSSRIIGRTPPTDEQREPPENVFYGSGKYTTDQSTELAVECLNMIREHKLKIVYDR